MKKFMVKLNNKWKIFIIDGEKYFNGKGLRKT